MATTAERQNVIGTPQRRLEGRDKVTGAAAFTADVRPEHLAHARLLLSPFAHAAIRGIDVTAALASPGVLAVITGADLPEAMTNGAEGALARDFALHAGQAVAVVVGETDAAAADGALLVDVDYEPRPALTDIDASMRPEAPLVIQQGGSSDEAATHGAAFGGGGDDDRPRNATTASKFEREDIDAAFGESAAVVERRYVVAGVHQGFLETHVSMARPDDDGGFIVWTSSQSRFDAAGAVGDALGVEHAKVRINPMAIGGGFGGKFVLLEPLVAYCARQVGRPVLLHLTRTEEFLIGRGAPGCVIDLKLGATAGGELKAMQARVYYDGGAAVGWHAGITAYFLGVPYRVHALDVRGYDIATHKTPSTAYRAPGAPQAFFAIESALDELAQKLGIDPIELRQRNVVREGDPNPMGAAWGRIGAGEVLEAASRHPLYTTPVEPGEGVGVALGAWGGANAPAEAVCRVDRDGSLVLQLGTVDVTGTDTTFAMIAAEVLGVSADRIKIEHPDSASAPKAPGSGGSVTTYSVGPAIEAAAAELRRKLLELASDVLEAAPEDLETAEGRVHVRGVPARSIDLVQLAAAADGEDRLKAHGEAAVEEAAPVFTVQIARARVDPTTGHFELTGFAAIQDIGRALNPPEVEGQIHGGALQSLGRAFGEELVYDSDGQLRTATFADYKLPTIDQVPEPDIVMLEVPSKLGSFGARHVGEPPAVPGAAALANAVSAASGKRVTTLPIDPESLLA
ncbi:MAG TPA: xanthine dehydrogenase family protein molybdopterin-binding subunit [Candidatus Dormibacteraeota bacterium]